MAEAIMSEKLIEKKLREAVKRRGGIALKFYCLSFTGMPDRFVLLPGGRLMFAELKTTGKKTSPRQNTVHAFLRNLGFTVAVIDDQPTLDEFLKSVAA